MRLERVLPPIALAVACLVTAPLTSAFAASGNVASAGKHDTAKGAAAGALAGHEFGHGHALAGAAVGAGVGHHEKTKAQEKAAPGNNG
jgi:hypothetical protein